MDQQTTLRDLISNEVEKLEPSTTAVIDAPEPSTAKIEGSETPVADEKPGRTAGRLRDEQGRLLPGKAEIPAQAPEAVTPGSAPSAAAPPAQEPPLNPPSSWRKDMWEHWQKLPIEVQKYTLLREDQAAKGVSTYKQEYEYAKPVMEALAPHMPLMQQYGIEPAKQVSHYMNLHKAIALGTEEQKLGVITRLAQDYKIPLEKLFVQGGDGRLYLNSQPAQQTFAPQPDVDSIVEKKLIEREATQQYQNFMAEKDTKYPHYETVKQTMAQLLESGIAPDLNSAYEAAVRLPQHSDIFEQIQQQKSAADEAEKARKLKEEADRARRNQVSVKSATPRSVSQTPAKGLRGALEQAFDEHMPGRV